MIGKILVFVYIMRISQAVFIETSEKHKDMVKMNPHGWQVVNVYHPPTQRHGYRYEPYTYPKYEFEYSVSDKKTGDHKHHHEARDGDQVRGEYSLVEADGSLRKVQYHANDHSGFNAIVSKTVNKHGDHAISVSDHTRFFYPMGHNIKINQYFPGKDYHYQDIEKHENNKISIPVHEESAGNNTDEGKMAVIEAGNKLMVLEPVKFDKQSNERTLNEVAPTQKTEAVTAVPIHVVSAIVPVIPQVEDKPAANLELMAEKPVEISPTELTSTNESEKENLDSEVASSFYHSKIYFIGY